MSESNVAVAEVEKSVEDLKSSAKTTRSDLFADNPYSLLYDPKNNYGRGNSEIQIDDELIAFARQIHREGQLVPILCRYEGKQKAVIVGSRRLLASRWIVDNIDPTWKIHYKMTRCSPEEAAFKSLSENLNRKDPNPIQIARSLRLITEQYGVSEQEVADAIGKPVQFVVNLVSLLTLPLKIQEKIESGEIKVTTALEIVKLPLEQQMAYVAEGEEKVTGDKVRKARRAAGQRVGRSVKEVREFFESFGAADGGRELAEAMVKFINGEIADTDLRKVWDGSVVLPVQHEVVV